MTEFRKVDLYDYFSAIRQIRHSNIEAAFNIVEVRQAIALYMFAGLPLAAATIYIGEALGGAKDIFGPRYDFTPGRNMTSTILDGQKIVGKTIDNNCGEIVKQFARYVDIRFDSRIGEMNANKPPSLQNINFTMPLLDRKEVIPWMIAGDTYFAAKDYYDFWMPSNDYPLYIRHWIKAFWPLYLSIYSQVKVLDPLLRKSIPPPDADALYRARKI